MIYRNFQTGDAPVVASWVRTPDELSLLDPKAAFPLTLGTVCDWAAHRTRAVVFPLPPGGNLAGYCELQVTPRKGRVRVWICREIVKPEFRGWGLGYEIGAEMLRIAREEHGAETILAWIAPQNARSLAVAQRAGLRIVGTDRVYGREFRRLEMDCHEKGT